MRYKELLQWVGHLPWFDLPMVTQGSREPKSALVNQLARWVREGKLLSLRRGMYAWPELYRKAPLSAPSLANVLCTPSYLSGLWALGFYGLIPEKVVTFTSATTRVPRTFQNALGTFRYSHLKTGFFWGTQRLEIDGTPVLIALPEKALLDHWHLHLGEWTPQRLEEMRYQNLDGLDLQRLQTMAERFGLPRLLRATARFLDLAEEQETGTQVL